MSTPQLIWPTLSRPSPYPSPPSSSGGIWRRPRRALPADLLREASRRLGVMSLVSGANGEAGQEAEAVSERLAG